MSDHPIDRVSGYAPIIMSALALLAVAKAVVNFKHHGPPLDEDGPWHIFVLMMVAQLPLIAYFIFKFRRELRKALPVVVAQLSLWAVSLATAWYVPGIY